VTVPVSRGGEMGLLNLMEAALLLLFSLTASSILFHCFFYSLSLLHLLHLFLTATSFSHCSCRPLVMHFAAASSLSSAGRLQ
jgi:hypothetical protein